MKILITGGAGFIGSSLADALIEKGDDVVIVDNLVTGKKEYINSQAKFYEVDICSTEIEDIFAKEKPDYVFHFAAQIDVRKSVDDPVFDNKVNALGSLNIFQTSAKNKVKKVIFASTGGALYGDVESPAKEEDLIEPLSPYAIHKYTAERYLEFLKEVHGLNYAVLRLANVYGIRQYKGGECGVIGIFTSNAVEKKQSIIYGDGSKTRDYVYISDVVNAFILAMKKDCSGVFNIGTEKETSVLDIVKAIENTTKEKFDYKCENDRPGEVKRSVLCCQNAHDLLGWKAEVDLKEGAQKTLKWIESIKNI
ncbi:NAD-dependent epimerase/dehydratase family protein [Candidatus Falkowbacteria bacterium]|jgi:UDP-glucose 4-epimerase|nr:NAD-dependent epimerase/dehydratase family protein [Candidatus Falkowbacteria bacterium]MBT4433357.1 NAD-dependent epimerase/dehydratase family protein [Candidatus Falkowbacteria bacterium]